MKKKTFLAVALASIIAGVAMGGIYEQVFVFPTTATIVATTLNMFVDGVPFTNGSALNWNSTYPGYVNYCNFTVQNAGDFNTSIYVTCDWSSNYTANGWTYTWTQNNVTLQPGEVAIGDLELYVPVTAPPKTTYSWTTYVLAEQT